MCRSSAWPRPAGPSTSCARGRRRASRSTAAWTVPRSTKLCGLLRYVDGDYKDPATFEALRRELGGAEHPAHYLAIPPPLFGPVVEQLARSGCAKGARVVVEKPFGQDLASARELNRILLGTFVEARHLPDRPLPRQAPRSQHAVLPLLESDSRGVLESDPRRERADHDGGGLRHPGPRRLLRRDGRHPRRRPEPPVPAVEQSRDGAAGENGQRVAAGRKGESPEVHSRAEGRGHRSRTVPRLPPGAWRRRRFAGRDVRRCPAPHRFVAMAGRPVLHPHRKVPARDVHGGRRPPAAAANGLFPTAAPLPNYFRFRIIPRQTVAFGVTAMDDGRPDDRPARRARGEPSSLAPTRGPPTSAS